MSFEANAPQMNPPVIELQIFIDVICPWCFVGKRRLEKALAMMEPGTVRLTWLPFQLNPDMPKEGMARRDYRIRKFGSWEHSQRLDAQLAALGAQENIPLRYDLMNRTPNTLDAHRLIWWRREAGQDAMVEAIFTAYFAQGRDIGDAETLADIAADSGLNRQDVLEFLASGKAAPEVSAMDDSVRRAGLSGVPAFVSNRQLLFTGAQPPETIVATLRALAVSGAAPPQGSGA